jgi:hypothetical protein
MDLLAMRPGAIAPTRYCPLIQVKGMDNRLHPTAIRKEGHHDHHHLHRLAQALQHRATPVAKRVFAHATALAVPLLIMDRDIALSSLASCRTRQMRAKLVRRVHRLLMFLLHKHIMPMLVTFFKPPPPISPHHVALPPHLVIDELIRMIMFHEYA